MSSRRRVQKAPRAPAQYAGQPPPHQPSAPTPHRPRRSDEAALATLEALYASLPALECQGLCAHSCSAHVDASIVERERIAAAGVDLDAPTADGACPALSRALVTTGRCTVHRLRPMICRLWGSAASMPCPHGSPPPAGRSAMAPR